MESTNAERRSQQRTDGTESSSESSLLPQPYSSSSAADSSLYLESCSCESGCTMCENGKCKQLIERWTDKKERDLEKKLLKTHHFLLFPREKDAKSLKTNEASKKIVTKSKSELLIDYCPYSSDNCGCSSGCTDCDYGLYTYTTKNKTKLKSKVGKEYVRSSNGFRPLKASEKSRRNVKPFSTKNVLRKKRTKLSKIGKTLENYPESSGSCDWKTEDQILESEKKKLASISRESKPARTARTLKWLSSEKVSERRLSWPMCNYSESDSNFSSEDRTNKNYGNIRQSRRIKTV